MARALERKKQAAQQEAAQLLQELQEQQGMDAGVWSVCLCINRTKYFLGQVLMLKVVFVHVLYL